MKNKIKILRLITRMNVGGPALQITGLQKFVDQNRFEQLLVSGYCDQFEEDYLDLNNISIPIKKIQGLGKRINIFYDIFVLIRLILIIRDYRPDIVHTHTTKAGFLGRIAAIVSLRNPTIVHTYHGHLLKGYFSNWKRLLLILVEKFLSYYTHKLICVGEKVKRDLIEVGIGTEDKFKVILPGIPRVSKKNKLNSIVKFNLNPNYFYCLYLGRLTKIKRPDRLLEIANLIKTKQLPMAILVAGSGDMLSSLKKNSLEKKLPIIFLNWISDVDSVLSASDLMILTSDNEGTPISLIQAQMVGLPVITTDVGSVKEVMIENKTGFIVESKPSAFMEKIEELYHDNELRLKMEVNAISFARENFTIEKIVNEHEILYSDLIKLNL